MINRKEGNRVSRVDASDGILQVSRLVVGLGGEVRKVASNGETYREKESRTELSKLYSRSSCMRESSS